MYVDTLLTQEKGVTLLRIRIILITFVLNLHIIMNVNIEQSWKDHLGEEFEKQYFVDLTEFVRSEYLRTTCYPPGKLIFNAFNLCPFDKVKVVIIGPDPYHEPGQAHGLSFSVADGAVLLLNATLTVRAHQAASHQRKGWEQFTDAAIKALSAERENLVFILWGGYARSKAPLIDTSRHLILQSVHPSPLSANRGGWFGNHHFSRCNEYLRNHGIEEIKW